MKGKVRGVISIALLGAYLLTVGFGAAPKKKTRTIRFGGGTQLEESKVILTRNAKGSAWVETEDMRITGNSIIVFSQENTKGSQSEDFAFDRIEAKGSVTFRANQPNATSNTPSKINATCASAILTQKNEQIMTLDGQRSIRQKVVLHDNVKLTAEFAPGGNIKGATMEGNQVMIATKSDGQFLLLADDAETTLTVEEKEEK